MESPNLLLNFRKEAISYIKTEQFYKLEAFFHYLYVFIILYIANRVFYYFNNPVYRNWVILTTAPIGVLILIFFVMILICFKIRRSKSKHEKISKNPWSLDFLKVSIYIIITVVILEVRLQDMDLIKEKSLYVMFWLSSELALLTWPTILSLETKLANVVILLFNFVYIYVRMHGYQVQIVESSFYFVKIIPLMIYLYKLRIFEEAKRQAKEKQKEERKLAAKVLSLMPEGIAIIEQDGLKYANNSMRTILRVKENECLEALFGLENTQFVDDSTLLSGLPKKSHTLPNNTTNKKRRLSHCTINLKQEDSRLKFPSLEKFENLEAKIKELRDKAKNDPDADVDEVAMSPLRLIRNETSRKLANTTSKIRLINSKNIVESSSVSEIPEVNIVDMQKISIDPKEDIEEGNSIFKEDGEMSDNGKTILTSFCNYF